MSESVWACSQAGRQCACQGRIAVVASIIDPKIPRGHHTHTDHSIHHTHAPYYNDYYYYSFFYYCYCYVLFTTTCTSFYHSSYSYVSTYGTNVDPQYVTTTTTTTRVPQSQLPSPPVLSLLTGPFPFPQVPHGARWGAPHSLPGELSLKFAFPNIHEAEFLNVHLLLFPEGNIFLNFPVLKTLSINNFISVSIMSMTVM